LLGLSAIERGVEQKAAAAPKTTDKIFWCDLQSGQIGFPTGTVIPSGLPGSIMKLITAAALLEEHAVTVDETLECRGQLELNGKTCTCLGAHGHVSLVKAIGLSCNVYFAKMSGRVSPNTIIGYASRFGLCSEVAGYPSGQFPKEATRGSHEYALGLASDLKPNALQLMRVAALVGTRGTAPDFRSPENPDPTGKPFVCQLSSSNWPPLQQGMRMAAREGTGKKLDPEDSLCLAVKTGTAPHGKTFQSWIIGYLPDKDPGHAFVVRSQIGTSIDAAVPAARKFLFSTKW
jgi:penicillin-binding protein 2